MASKPTSRRGRGVFIVLDGPDGAGKSTQVAKLVERLRGAGVTVVQLREPGGTAAGEEIRALVLEQRGRALGARAEMFLFQAARAQLVDEVIRPALERGEWVVCDRFTLSTLVYQGLAGQAGRGPVERLSELATAGLKPDATFVVWVPLQTGVARRAARAADRMESKGDAFLRAVSNGFRSEARRDPKRYTLIDGRGSIEAVHASIWAQVERLLPRTAKPAAAAKTRERRKR